MSLLKTVALTLAVTLVTAFASEFTLNTAPDIPEKGGETEIDETEKDGENKARRNLVWPHCFYS